MAKPTRITRSLIDKLQPASTDVWVWDSELPGFGVRVRPSGRKTYMVRYRSRAGVQRKLNIGRCCDMTPDKAKDMAREVFTAVAAGNDPASDRSAQPTSNTVERLFSAYVADMRARGRASSDEVERALLLAKNNAADALGRQADAAEVSPSQVVGYIAKLYRSGRRGAADKHRSYIASAYAWAMRSANDYTVEHRQDWGISRNPVADIARDQGAVRARDRNLSASELQMLWQDAEPGRASGFNPETAACIRMLIACGQRVQETLRIEGKEIDLQAMVWSMPASKTKLRTRGHDVPLPASVAVDIRLLTAMHGNGALFPGRLGKPIMDHRSINRALARWAEARGVAPFQSRDLRRTWKSRSHDAGLSIEMRDIIQQHARPGAGSKHYDRAIYLPQMRAAMQLWDDWIMANLEPSSTACQRPVGPLAGEAGCAGFISVSSNSVRSLVKPALHVGEHSGGLVGCLA